MENDVLTNDLLFNLIQDFKKKEISPIIKGKIIKMLADNTGMSINALSREMNIPKTTIHTYARYEKLGQENYDNMRKEGWEVSDIHNLMKSSGYVRSAIKNKKIDVLLDKAKAELSTYVHEKNYSPYTAEKIRELQNVLNRILMRVEQ